MNQPEPTAGVIPVDGLATVHALAAGVGSEGSKSADALVTSTSWDQDSL
jgi:hypothetical protein